MSEDYNPFNRVDRFKKRRNNTKAITIFGVAGLVFVVILIGIFVFGGKDDDKVAQSAGDDTTNEQTEETSNQVEQDDDESTDQEEDVEVTEPEVDTEGEQAEEPTTDSVDEQYEVVKETVASDDENVIEAYTANWKPIGTSQVGEHQVNWAELTETQDWPEILGASSLATNVNMDDMIGWWVEGNGEGKVISTISNKAQTDTYRVYLTWVDQEGWMPTKVEVLKENDKKQNFEDDSSENETEESEESIETPTAEQENAEEQTDNSSELEVVQNKED